MLFNLYLMDGNGRKPPKKGAVKGVHLDLPFERAYQANDKTAILGQDVVTKEAEEAELQRKRGEIKQRLEHFGQEPSEQEQLQQNLMDDDESAERIAELLTGDDGFTFESFNKKIPTLKNYSINADNVYVVPKGTGAIDKDDIKKYGLNLLKFYASINSIDSSKMKQTENNFFINMGFVNSIEMKHSLLLHALNNKCVNIFTEKDLLLINFHNNNEDLFKKIHNFMKQLNLIVGKVKDTSVGTRGADDEDEGDYSESEDEGAAGAGESSYANEPFEDDVDTPHSLNGGSVSDLLKKKRKKEKEKPEKSAQKIKSNDDKLGDKLQIIINEKLGEHNKKINEFYSLFSKMCINYLNELPIPILDVIHKRLKNKKFKSLRFSLATIIVLYFIDISFYSDIDRNLQLVYNYVFPDDKIDMLKKLVSLNFYYYQTVKLMCNLNFNEKNLFVSPYYSQYYLPKSKITEFEEKVKLNSDGKLQLHKFKFELSKDYEFSKILKELNVFASNDKSSNINEKLFVSLLNDAIDDYEKNNNVEKLRVLIKTTTKDVEDEKMIGIKFYEKETLKSFDNKDYFSFYKLLQRYKEVLKILKSVDKSISESESEKLKLQQKIKQIVKLSIFFYSVFNLNIQKWVESSFENSIDLTIFLRLHEIEFFYKLYLNYSKSQNFKDKIEITNYANNIKTLIGEIKGLISQLFKENNEEIKKEITLKLLKAESNIDNINIKGGIQRGFSGRRSARVNANRFLQSEESSGYTFNSSDNYSQTDTSEILKKKSCDKFSDGLFRLDRVKNIVLTHTRNPGARFDYADFPYINFLNSYSTCKMFVSNNTNKNDTTSVLKLSNDGNIDFFTFKQMDNSSLNRNTMLTQYVPVRFYHGKPEIVTTSFIKHISLTHCLLQFYHSSSDNITFNLNLTIGVWNNLPCYIVTGNYSYREKKKDKEISKIVPVNIMFDNIDSVEDAFKVVINPIKNNIMNKLRREPSYRSLSRKLSKAAQPVEEKTKLPPVRPQTPPVRPKTPTGKPKTRTDETQSVIQKALALAQQKKIKYKIKYTQ